MTTNLVWQLDIVVSYSSIAVADTSLDAPFNDWTRAHVRQGFSWRPSSVSFGTLENIDMFIEVRLDQAWIPRRDALRVIRVPFTVGGAGTLFVGSVGMEHYISLPVGSYSLIYEHGILRNSGVGRIKPNEKLWAVLTFIPGKLPEPAVLLADEELDPPTPLVMTADPV